LGVGALNLCNPLAKAKNLCDQRNLWFQIMGGIADNIEASLKKSGSFSVKDYSRRHIFYSRR
jgi:hypothetical protein